MLLFIVPEAYSWLSSAAGSVHFGKRVMKPLLLDNVTFAYMKPSECLASLFVFRHISQSDVTALLIVVLAVCCLHKWFL